MTDSPNLVVELAANVQAMTDAMRQVNVTMQKLLDIVSWEIVYKTQEREKPSAEG